jgi:site-specific DNA-methyltransferase (cytosine-N4-specific)
MAKAFGVMIWGGVKRGEKTNFCIHCGAWKGQHGLEPDFRLYIEHIRLWAREAWRVLKDDGLFFMNLGDSFGGSWGAYGDGTMRGNQKRKRVAERWERYGTPKDIIPPTVNAPYKCKLMIPARAAIALIDDGWILRNDIVWWKINAMPESVKDRFSSRHENIFMFSKSSRYYFNLDAVREPHKEKTLTVIGTKRNGSKGTDELGKVKSHGFMSMPERTLNPAGVNPGDVWEYATQPSQEKHYAMWPEKLVERMIRCSTRPRDIVVDPFVGSGSTLRVADRLNRIGYGIDLGYQDIQERKLREIQKELILG